MATFLIKLPTTIEFSALAAAGLAGIYMLLRKQGANSRMRILLTSAACLVVLMWGLSAHSKRATRAASRTAAAVAASHTAFAKNAAAPTGYLVTVSSRLVDAPRSVYGHSIVKGGIHSVGELLDVIARDPLAAQHYKGFDITRAHFIRLDHNIMAYVSYRVDGKGIFWTAKPELIMAGEEVITDGTNFIRVRCGNMISYSPQKPVETDTPTDTNNIVQTFTPFSDTPLANEVAYTPDNTTGGREGGTPPPAGGPPSNCCSGGFTPPIFTPPTPNTPGGPGGPGTPPTVVPTVTADEFPGLEAFYTLFAGILVLFLVGKVRP
jgi:hypothetical protein